MNLHIFNPEHDIALAANHTNFTAPHAGRQLRHDLGFLPALWCEEGDSILVDSMEDSKAGLERLLRNKHMAKAMLPKSTFVTWKQMASGPKPEAILPWGWNKDLCYRLAKAGLEDGLLPSDSRLETIRQLSHRATAKALLQHLRREGTVGEAFQCTSEKDVTALLDKYGKLVLKAPWSSSGRGLRFLDKEKAGQQGLDGWLRNVLKTQECVMAEPFYNKVKDFGMEFECRNGKICYLGLSLFHTRNGAYAGNVLATEHRKRLLMGHYLPEGLLETAVTDIGQRLEAILPGHYEGPFGIDMMVVSDNEGKGFLLHPCVEINLRRTMGHVALALEQWCNPGADDDVQHVMRIEYADNNYKLRISKL